MENDKRQAGTKIDVTPEMLEAGVSQIQGFNYGSDSHCEVVQQVYLAMEIARHRSGLGLASDGYPVQAIAAI